LEDQPGRIAGDAAPAGPPAEELAERLRVLGEVGRIAASSLEVEEILPQVLDHLCRRFHYEFATAGVVSEGKIRLRAQASRGEARALAGYEQDLSRGVAGHVVRTGKSLLLDDVREFPDYVELFPGVRSELCVPLRIPDEVLGVLDVESTRPAAFDEDDRVTLETVADILARAVHNSLLFEEVRRKNRELEEMDGRRSDFINMMAHDLKTPLQSIVSYTDLMLMYKDEPPEVQEEFLMTVKREAGRLAKLVEDFLDVARIESGTFQYAFEVLDPSEILGHFVQIYTVQCDLQKVRFVVEAPGPLPAVRGDKRRLGQVFSNILSNALKFTPVGGTVTLRALRDAADGDGERLHVAISDTGPGIEARDMERLFKKFTVIHPTTRFRRGTGLGLPIAREIVERHGGSIWVESEVGKGSTFHFTIPALEGDAAREGAEEARGA
jgi:signal transduction histidine kinase